VSKIVLCVDDSATMQQVADITFRGTEFQYVGARSVDEALQKAKAQKPAVVLADSQMPGKTGYDLCLALKQEMGDVPVVILVGNGAPYDAAKGTQVGADANLPKPWDTQTMLEKVTEIVSKGATAKPGQAAAGAAAAPAAAAKPAAASNQPPRSATIMGMPTIKMPAGVATPVTAVPPAPKTTAMAVPPMAPQPATTTPGSSPGLRPPASPSASSASASASSSAPAPSSSSSASSTPGVLGMNRSPMVSGNATKRSQLVEATLAKMASRIAEISGLNQGSPELAALLKLSHEVVERIVWEVVPDLAEQIIRENLNDLAAARRS
jgi:CheY-like chemotaxis protein